MGALFTGNNPLFFYIKKGEYPSTQGVYKGSNNQERNLQASKKLRKDKNDWFRKAADQSIKVLKKNSFKSDMDLSLSSTAISLPPKAPQ